jgi:hypothetical protein
MVDQFNVESSPNGGFRESESYSVETLGSRECGRQGRLFVGRCILALNGKPGEEIQALLQDIQRQSAGEACVLTIIRFQ